MTITIKSCWQAMTLLLAIIATGAAARDATSHNNAAQSIKAKAVEQAVELVVLGNAQDAGYPQINCYKPHCMPGWQDPAKRRLATSLGLIDHGSKQKFLFEATPDIKWQLYRLHQLAADDNYQLAGIMLTHGHMGHYTGLMHLGREAASSKGIPVYAMPRMRHYLANNGPWSQLVSLSNISLKALVNHQPQRLTPRIVLTPLQVPHRDEFTETVGYHIAGPNKTALFIPDIDKWQKWSLDIVEQIKKVDFALLDGTFFANGELPNRDMHEVPHPFVEESMALFAGLSKADKYKVIFIHFNHTNPLLQAASAARQQLTKRGFRYAVEGMTLAL